ncbi:MAG: lysophospholipid acyltransferase family protein [Flavobacteriales bacterium]
MSAILYWLVIKPLSLLPMWLLYGVSDFLFVVLYYLIGYRKKVVRINLQNCFPEKSKAELLRIEKKFFRHLCDLVIESLKNFSITEKQASKRMKHHGAEIFEHYAAKNQSVIIAGGHYGNWELWAVTVAAVVPHRVVGIYKRLSNQFFDKKMQHSRSRFGLSLVSTKETRDYFSQHEHDLTAIVFAVDQSPSNPKKCLWITFMGRETAALFGTEKYAVEYNRPVILGQLKKLKRGHYEVHYELVCENPAETDRGYLTQLMHDKLEEKIRETPEYWLWSHKRWKHQRPEAE